LGSSDKGSMAWVQRQWASMLNGNGVRGRSGKRQIGRRTERTSNILELHILSSTAAPSPGDGSSRSFCWRLGVGKQPRSYRTLSNSWQLPCSQPHISGTSWANRSHRALYLCLLVEIILPRSSPLSENLIACKIALSDIHVSYEVSELRRAS